MLVKLLKMQDFHDFTLCINAMHSTWVDHADTSSILSINKSLYTPYQVLFTNDYAEGTDDFYKDPKALPADNAKFNTDTTSFIGYTKYDGGKVRTLYEEGKVGKLYAKVEAAEDEYTDKGEIKVDNSKKITIPKDNIFDAQFAGNSKEYRAYEYKVDLTKMLPYHSEDKNEKQLTLLKDMKFVSNASDGSSLPSDLYETRVRARVLFDANTGKLADDKEKEVRIVPDNIKFYGEEGYVANGFEGANVEANTGDKFPDAPKLEGNNFLGWVTEAGKQALGNKAVVTVDAFNGLPKDQIFTNETPITKHLVVYAVYSNEVTVTFDANQGRFNDDKDTTTVKADETGNVTKPADPTRDGYEFKGWADKKDATTANVTEFTGITAPKTYYAVWEKKADSDLTLNKPAVTPVADPNGLTSAEKDAVIQAIIDANPTAGLTPADIKVENDGTATVSKDGKTKEFKPSETVEQKEVQNNFNPPKEPVLVDNTGALTPKEKQAVKDAVKEANKDRNLTDDDITVENDGKVTINQGGKTGTIPADKTVKAKDSVLTLTDPEITEVKDPNNLTEEEKAAVKKAVIAKNSGLTENDITVDSKGNVSVKTGAGKTGEIPAAKTVKEKDLSKLNKPAITPVADDKLLTENEKQAVKDAIKAANKDYDLKDDEITVDDNGKATVTRGTSSKEFTPAETVKKDSKLLDVKAPKKTEVANINKLTEPEQEAVEAAIIAANPDLKLTKEEVVINDDGSAVITKDGKEYTLAQADTVVEDLKYPEITEVDDPAKLSDNEKEEVERAVRKANPNLPAGTTIAVANDGTVTVTYPESDGRDAATIPAKNTVVKNNTKDKTAPAAPEVAANNDGTVKITPPKDSDVKSMDITYTPEGEDTTPKTVTATKDDYGNWSLPSDSGLNIEPSSGVVTIPADKVKDGTDVTAKAKDGSNNESEAGTDKAKKPGAIVAPAKPVEVANPSNLTPEEKEAVKKAIKDANPTLTDDQIKVNDDGTVTVTDASGKTIGTLTPKQTVKKAGTPTPQPDKKSQQPSVDPIYDSDDYVTGRGTPGATIVVRFPDGLTETTVVEYDERWAVRVPYVLYDGVRVYVTQIERDKTESYPVSAEVRYDDEYWRERDRYSRYDRRDKEVKEEKKPTQPSKVEPRWTPSALNAHDHFSYIKGYGDNKFEPNKTITRAEVAMIFARLSLNKSTAGAPQFKDVKAGDWYKTAIDIIARQGVIKGYEDGTFRPNQPITRREFAAIAARYAGNIDTWKTFRDVPPTDWAYTLINRVAGAGWINGYEDGTFRPNNNITRAEVVAIVNRMLNRTADKAYVENNLMNSSNAFVDNMRSAWYYYDIYEAAFGHSYERMMNGVDEKWNRVNGQSFEVRER